MFGRGSFLAFLVGGAALPYLLSSGSGVREAITSPLQAVTGTTEKPAVAPHAAAEIHAAGHAAPAAHTAADPAATKPVSAHDEKLVPFEQALRWEITPVWVMSTWPRVTTHLSELDAQGYRVTLVSGTAQSDIAGALTYYFDAKQQLQRITFNGTTGDARRLVQFLVTNHRFERRLLDDPSVYLYQVEQDQRALSELKIKTAPIVRASGALSRFEVSLVMRRPAK
ncbi:MAG: hypothetical protein K8U03_08200 [Planctomycetia bacterium]|nr:hypothetical protein [Planctomycetia bacterium]